MTMVEIGVRTIDDMREEIKEEIDSKFNQCRRIIGKAKWRGNFSSSRRKEETFGRWNKGCHDRTTETINNRQS